MRLLIVEVNKQLAEVTAEQLRLLDQQARCIETITLAGDLDSAIRLLPEHDVVICDGRFPISQDSRFLADKWSAVRRDAGRRGIHFVLYSAGPSDLDDACVRPMPAIPKPAAIEEIYAQLTKHCLEQWLVAISNKLGH